MDTVSYLLICYGICKWITEPEDTSTRSGFAAAKWMPVLGSFHIELCSTGTVFLSGWWRRRLCLSSRKGWQIHLATDCMNIWSNSTSLLTSPILGVDDGQGSYCTPPLQESHPVFPLVCAAPFSSWGGGGRKRQGHLSKPFHPVLFPSLLLLPILHHSLDIPLSFKEETT